MMKIWTMAFLQVVSNPHMFLYSYIVFIVTRTSFVSGRDILQPGFPSSIKLTVYSTTSPRVYPGVGSLFAAADG